MIIVIATITVKEKEIPQYLQILKKNTLKVLNEEGCIEYYPIIDKQTRITAQKIRRNQIIIIEKWEDQNYLETHLNAPHMKDYRREVKDMVENVDMRILREI